MRVAVSQFATSLNTQENLATCIRMIDETAVCKPSLIVLPSFCNTLFCDLQPCYVNYDQAWEQALAVDGHFLQAIAEQAEKHKCYIALSVTLQRETLQSFSKNQQHSDSFLSASVKPNISITSCLFSPLGKLIHQIDKQMLTKQESYFFTSSQQCSDTAETPFGKLGFLAGSDICAFKNSRHLALNGAQLLCHSTNEFSLDQSNLHSPTRACENKIFLATANKIGALIPLEQIPQESEATSSIQSTTAQEFLRGVGQSQIISPNGKILAKLDHNEEGFTFADIDLAEANCKFRPDNTELNKQRRPELYKALLSTEQASQYQQHDVAPDNKNTNLPETVNVAIFATYKTNEQAIEDVCHYIENNLSDIIQLPELFFLADKTITNDSQQLALLASLSEQLINQISSVLRPCQYVCTSLIIAGAHQAVIISEHGLFATQQQLHFCQRYQWTELGGTITTITLPLEQGTINIAMLTADDANIPEIIKVAALNNIHLLLVPFDIQESCEVEYSLLSRAAEHRICIVAASREKSFSNEVIVENNKNQKKKVKSKKSTGFIANLTVNSDLLSSLKSPRFNGYLNKPVIKYQHGKITKALIHPLATCSK